MHYGQNAPKQAVKNTKFLFCTLMLYDTSFSDTPLCNSAHENLGFLCRRSKIRSLNIAWNTWRGPRPNSHFVCPTVCRMSRCPTFLGVQLERWSQKHWAQNFAVLYGTGRYLCRGAEIHWQCCCPPSFDLQNHHNFPVMLQICVTNLSLWTKGLLFWGNFCRPFRSNPQTSAWEITPWRNVNDIKEKGSMLWSFFLLKKPSL